MNLFHILQLFVPFWLQFIDETVPIQYESLEPECKQILLLLSSI